MKLTCKIDREHFASSVTSLSIMLFALPFYPFVSWYFSKEISPLWKGIGGVLFSSAVETSYFPPSSRRLFVANFLSSSVIIAPLWGALFVLKKFSDNCLAKQLVLFENSLLLCRTVTMFNIYTFLATPVSNILLGCAYAYPALDFPTIVRKTWNFNLPWGMLIPIYTIMIVVMVIQFQSLSDQEQKSV